MAQRSRRPPVAHRGVPYALLATLPLVARDLRHHGLGHVRELPGHLADRLAAQDVAGADPDPFLVAEAPDDRRRVLGALAELGQLGLDRRARRRPVHDQRINQVVDHPRVIDQDLGEELAGGAQLDVEPQARRVEIEELPEDRLGAERRRDLLQVGERHVRVGRAADGLQQPRRDRGQEVPAAGLRQEGEVLAGQGQEILMRRGAVAEGVSTQHFGDQLGGGVRVEHEVDDGVHRRAVVAAEGVVQQVVEDPPVQLGLAPIVRQEPGRGAGPRLPIAGGRVAHPECQRPDRFHVARHLVRLAVEDDLEPVLDAAEEPVGVVHHVALLGAQASDSFELRDGVERVPAAHLGIFAAVQQLEELDDELDVADAAAARLDLDLRRAGRERCAARSDA